MLLFLLFRDLKSKKSKSWRKNKAICYFFYFFLTFLHQNVGVAFFFAQTGISAHIESTFTRASSSSTFFWFSPVHVLAHRNFRNSRFSPNRRFLRNRDDKWPLRASKAPILTKWISAFTKAKTGISVHIASKRRCCVFFCVPRRLKQEFQFISHQNGGVAFFFVYPEG